jgi:hypothetical protein
MVVSLPILKTSYLVVLLKKARAAAHSNFQATRPFDVRSAKKKRAQWQKAS